MSIYKYEPFHGAVLHRLIKDNSLSDLVIKPGLSKNSYLIRESTFGDTREEKTIGIFIKYSGKRLTPWRYSIYREEQEEMKLLEDACNTVFLLLVNRNDGIACLEYGYLKQLLDDSFEDVEWISVNRKRGEEYGLKGKDGKLNRKIPRNLYPKLVLDKLNEISV